MKNKIGIIIGVIVVAAGIWMFTAKSRAAASSAETVRIVKPEMGDIRVTISSQGTILPENRLQIKPPVNGRIEKLLVKEGQQVKSGEILAQMSSTDRAALLDAARGQGETAINYWQDVYKSISLIAPMDGQVIVATIQPGQTVTTADDVVVLSDRLIVRAQVDETDIGKVKLGQNATITLDAYPDVRIKASVKHVYYESKTVNNVTVYEVDLSLEQVPEFFRSGMNTNVDFVIENKEDVLVIPSEVVQRRQRKSVVTIKSEGMKTEEREIVLGAADDKNVEVVSGLTEDDEIVYKSQKYRVRKEGGTNPFMPNAGARGGQGQGRR